MKLSQAAEYMNGQLSGEDSIFSAVKIDSRNVGKGDLFIALKGLNHDAHDYVESIDESDIAGFVISKDVETTKPSIKVDDTRIALGQLAKGWRKEFSKTKFIGITGSNGKTTVKEMLLAILSLEGNSSATEGNFNNDIGMPLTLLSVDKDKDFAIIEMGANHPGEIEYLSKIANADVVLVNNAGPAHLEGFGDIEGVAKAKGEIYENLNGGVAVINLDDDYASYWKGLNANNTIITYSLKDKSADVFGALDGSVLCVETKAESYEINQHLLGEHNAKNALAAIAVSTSLNVPSKLIQAGLQGVRPVKGRLYPYSLSNDVDIIDDTYNANLTSFKAAIDVLATFNKSTYLIMGDMGELGSYVDDQHEAVVDYANEKKIDNLIACGKESAKAALKFNGKSKAFEDKDSLIKYIKNENIRSASFVVKGSRFMAMDSITTSLLDHYKIEGK